MKAEAYAGVRLLAVAVIFFPLGALTVWLRRGEHLSHVVRGTHVLNEKQ